MKLIDSALKPEFTSMFDVEHIRADFPILKLQVEGKPLVYQLIDWRLFSFVRSYT